MGGDGLHAHARIPDPRRRIARRPVRPSSDLRRRCDLVRRSPRCCAAPRPSIGILVAARMLQGVGGALLTPGSLAIIQASFHPDDRARAIGAWSGFGGVTTAIGPLAGGWLVDAASWRWIFLLNLPLAGLVVWIAVRHIPESRDGGHLGPTRLARCRPLRVGLAGATWGLIDRSWALGVIGVAGLVAFVVVEYRSRHPMLPLGIFRSRQFTTANIVTLLIYGGLGAVLFLIGLVLQESLGLLADRGRRGDAPDHRSSCWRSRRGPGRSRSGSGPALPMTLGPAVMAVGMLLMTRIEPGRSYVSGVLPGMIVFAGGLALTVAPLTATVLAAADPAHSGVASGVNNAMARVGALLAVASVPMVAGFSPERAGLTDGARRRIPFGAPRRRRAGGDRRGRLVGRHQVDPVGDGNAGRPHADRGPPTVLPLRGRRAAARRPRRWVSPIVSGGARRTAGRSARPSWRALRSLKITAASEHGEDDREGDVGVHVVPVADGHLDADEHQDPAERM